MRSIIKNKKAQEVSVWVWFTVIIGILIVAPILTYMIVTPIVSMAGEMNKTNEVAGNAGVQIATTFTNFWDSIIVFAFFIITLLLFISAFFIDTHAIFVILYLISAIVLVLIAPAINQLTDEIWNRPEFSSAVSILPMTDFIRTHIFSITLGIIILSGVITFAKFKYFSSQWQ